VPRVASPALVEIERISGAAAKPYVRLAPGRFRDRLAAGRLEPELVLVGASIFGAPAGAALARLAPDGVAHVEAVYVDRVHRQAGVGAALAARLDEAVATRPAVALFVRDAPSGEAVAAIATRLGWSPPAPHALEYAFGRRVLDTPVLNTRGPRPRLRTMAFAELPPADLPALDPAPGVLLRHASFAAFRGAELAGWATMHATRPGRATWSGLRIARAAAGFGVAHALVAPTVRAALEQPGIERVEGMVVLGNEAMERIVRRWFAPHVDMCRLLHVTHRAGRG
jgi:hypothetical protein